MKKTILVVLVLMLLFGNTGCLKDKEACTPRSVQNEQAAMLAYASANGITPTAHASGMYYQIINPGSGASPTLSSNLTVNYVGKFISNNTIFDSSNGTPVTFPLSNVIAGWQAGLPLISKGGTIKMIIPSSMAYGCTGYQTIPPDAVLFFEVNLIDVQ